MRCLVVGAAKSGTTAVLALIGQAMAAPRLFVEEPLEDVMAALRMQPGDAVAKVIFGNESAASIVQAADAFDRRVLLVRDPRDVLVSSLLYALASRPTLLGDAAFLDRFGRLVRAKQADPATVRFVDLARVFDTPAGVYVDRVLGRQADLVRFVTEAGAPWHVLRYEDVVGGRLDALSSYLGLPLRAGTDVPPEYLRVARTRSAGDWRHWFTPHDIAELRPACDPVLRSLGYPAEWAAAPSPRIAPEHSWRYLDRLVDERRLHFGLGPEPRAAAATLAPCNLCGGTAFGPGPAGRLALNGMLPCCQGCGSLERQRAVGRLLQALPPGFLDWRRALQFTPDNGLPAAAFRSLDTELVDDGMDRRLAAREEGSVDLVAFSHLLEYVPDDRREFVEMVRLLSPRGVLVSCFAAAASRPRTLELAGSASGVAPRRLYGRDIAQRLECAAHGLSQLTVEGSDPCTGLAQTVHLFLKDRQDAARMHEWLLSCSSSLRLVLCAEVPGSAMRCAGLQEAAPLGDSRHRTHPGRCR